MKKYPKRSLYLSLKFLHPGLGSFKGVCIGYVINYDGGLSSSETKNKGYDLFSVADPICLSRITDPYFSIPDPGSRLKKISDLGYASKNLSMFNTKIVSKLSEI
jgi:hypothetical protein